MIRHLAHDVEARRRRGLVRLTATALALLAACTSRQRIVAPGPGTTLEQLRVGGTTRAYALHVPHGLPDEARAPLVIVLHGYNGSGTQIERESGFDRLADSAGFVVAYPYGTTSLTRRRHWDASARSADLDFFRTLIDTVRRRRSIDSTRVFVAGFSNGAFMAYRVGESLGDRVRAIAVVAGSVGQRSAIDVTAPHAIALGRPVPAIVFHGMADNVVPFDEEHGSTGRMHGIVSAPMSALLWARANGCAPSTATDTLSGGDAIRTTYVDCPEGANVVLYALPRGGHGWPNESHAGTRLAASSIIWTFFESQTR